MASKYHSSHTLSFEQGIPVYGGEAELLEEYLDRVATLEQAYPDEVQKKNGPLGPRLYNALRGEAYLAARSKGIDKSKLSAQGGVKLILEALKEAIRGDGPNRIGELFDTYFDSGQRKTSEAMSTWLVRRAEARQQLLAADPSTTISDNVEAFFLAEVVGTVPTATIAVARVGQQHLQAEEACRGHEGAVRRRAQGRARQQALAVCVLSKR